MSLYHLLHGRVHCLHLFHGLLSVFAVMLCCPSLFAQVDAPATEGSQSPDHQEDEPDKPEASSAQDDAEELKARVAELETTVLDLQTKVGELQSTVSQRQTSEPGSLTNPQTSAAKKESVQQAGLSDQQTPLQDHDTLRDDHDATARPGNAPLDPTLTGFFRLGSTGVWMKLNGYMKVDMMVDSTVVGNPNLFATSSIFVESQAEFGQPPSFNFSAKESRLGAEIRRTTPIGSLRVVYENDFLGDSASPDMVYRLRHLYGQLANLVVGSTWTTFVDTDALPDTLDIEGPGVSATLRQPQIRYSLPLLRNHASLAFALEQPRQDINTLPTNAQASLVAPDVTAAFRLEERRGHIHLGALVRYLAYSTDDKLADGALGWGFNLSGSLSTLGSDRLVANVTFGQGIGRYAQDLGRGNAAAVNSDGKLIALTTLGGFAGYLHHWNDSLRTQLTYGYLHLGNIAEQSADAYRLTHYLQTNLIWGITPRFNAGIECLYGRKVAHAGSSGDAYRGQLSMQYSIF